jgi:hypothetical protein
LFFTFLATKPAFSENAGFKQSERTPPLYEIDRVGLQYFSECKAVQNIAGTDKIEAFD